ncbi:MAG: atpH, partial [Nocardioides sp.]|nr:atpH [Nocardioides sp.]
MAFRGASADALTALTGELGSKVSTPGTAATVAGDLYTVESTFRSEGAFRRFATDSAIPVEAKQGLVTDLFGGKIDGVSLELLTSAVGRRWVAGR